MVRRTAAAGTGLSRRALLAAVLATPALVGLLAACGDGTTTSDPTSGTSDPTSATTGTTETTGPVQGDIIHPTGADEVIFRFGYVGGFVPVGFAFTSVPNLLISGDGRLITPGVTPAIYPGPLLPALNERTITEAGIQKLLALAGTAGLLAPPPDYSGEIMVADAADTLVVINADGETYTHLAPALGFEEPNESDARKALAKFVEIIGDISAVVGDESLGEDGPLVAASYRIQSRAITPEEIAGYDPAPTLTPWPADIAVSLADAGECVVIPADKVASLLADAKQDTFFTESAGTVATVTESTTTGSTVTSANATAADVIYQVSAVAVLPGDVC